MTIRLTKKRRLPEDTKGARVLTPYGEIHVKARTLEFVRDMNDDGGAVGLDIQRLCGALMFDCAAGFISESLVAEITKRVKRVQRGSPARLNPH
jgi:hypothetical protein